VKDKTLAAIDIGTNTFRLLIAKMSDGPPQIKYDIKEIHSERIITRLGDGMHENGYLKKEAIDRSVTALRKFCKIIALHGVDKITALATSALREARNSNEFLDAAKKVTELPIEIISGEQEAKITAMGMLLDTTVPETAFMVDIGGGSTELIYAIKGIPEIVLSLNTGVVYLAGKYMTADPPSEEDLILMEEEIVDNITGSAESFRKSFSNNTAMIGTAGTVTALAAMSQNLKKFEHIKIHNYRLLLHKVKDIFSTISRLSSHERARHIPFELSRLDIIVPGTLILSKLMDIFGFEEIRVSNYGLREGILIRLYNQMN
jgi:exopolyphosphatase/guanosine-5'-triphosphate,3'-diphosphate pyrophosphatase